MKKLLFISSAMMLSICLNAQTTSAAIDSVAPPAIVKDAFMQKYAEAKKVKWEQEDQKWEAEFVLSSSEMTACFDLTGKWLETETSLKVRNLPSEIEKAIELRFEDWEIEEVCKIESSTFNGYEIEIEKSNAKAELTATSASDLTIKDVEVEDGHGKHKGKKGEKSKDNKKGKEGKH
jgi:hypothetical protein